MEVSSVHCADQRTWDGRGFQGVRVQIPSRPEASRYCNSPRPPRFLLLRSSGSAQERGGKNGSREGVWLLARREQTRMRAAQSFRARRVGVLPLGVPFSCSFPEPGCGSAASPSEGQRARAPWDGDGHTSHG